MRFGLLAVFILWALPVQAEVHSCAGIWTDRPCERINHADADSAGEADDVSRQKRAIIADLRRFAERVQAEIGRRDFESDATEDFCMKPEVSIEECRVRALRADKSLMSTFQTVSRIRQRAVELAQKQQEISLRRERQMREIKGTSAKGKKIR